MSYRSSWRSPSNIALVKYWGKHGLQLPRNPSLSFTLSACHTTMAVEVTSDAISPGLVVLYAGQPKPSFEPKVKSFFTLIEDRFPWLTRASIVVDSQNTFPHGAGIASSASAMSALTICLIEIDTKIKGLPPHAQDAIWWRKASEIARLGSGSACRSVYPVAAMWGEMPGVEGSSDLYAIPCEEKIAPLFKDYQDTILIVSSSEKSVSSSAGHILMETLTYANVRYAEARKNLPRLMESMKREDSDLFISIVESEALQLHALMMCGDSPYILMEPDTVSIIKEVWRFRKDTAIPVCFTLDAGPNVHLLYPYAFRDKILDWIQAKLVSFCADGKYIMDHVGMGPEKIS